MLVDGLLRQGALTELVGPLSSGRTSLLIRCLRTVTRRGGLAALVDVDHAFDPRSAAAAGVALHRLLWVRSNGRRRDARAAVDLLARCPGFVLVALDVGESPPRLSLGAAFRLRSAARRSGVAVLVVGARRTLGGAASLSVCTWRDGLGWVGSPRVSRRLAGMSTGLRVIRSQGAPGEPDEQLWWTA
jgi:hypothetical protein